MMTPQQLETVLRVRVHRRDRVRMALASILAENRTIEDRLRQTESDRADTLAALRAGMAGGSIDVDRSAALRYHAARLSIEITAITNALAANAERVKAARTALAAADRDVKTVERLRERQHEVARRDAERRADREATDRFAATRERRGPPAPEEDEPSTLRHTLQRSQQ